MSTPLRILCLARPLLVAMSVLVSAPALAGPAWRYVEAPWDADEPTPKLYDVDRTAMLISARARYVWHGGAWSRDRDWAPIEQSFTLTGASRYTDEVWYNLKQSGAQSTFRRRPGEPDWRSPTTIYRIELNPDGTGWAVSHKGHIFRWDGVHFSDVPVDGLEPGSGSGAYAHAMGGDRHGGLWLRAHMGVVYHVVDQRTRALRVHSPNVQSGWGDVCIQPDGKGILTGRPTLLWDGQELEPRPDIGPSLRCSLGGKATWVQTRAGQVLRVTDGRVERTINRTGRPLGSLAIGRDGVAFAMTEGRLARFMDGAALDFRDRSVETGLNENGYGRFILIPDLDQDGLPDLLLVNRGGPVRGWRNRGNWRFVPDPSLGEMMGRARFGYVGAACDLDADGDLDVLTRGADRTRGKPRLEPVHLMRTADSYVDVTERSGFGDVDGGHSASAIGDIDCVDLDEDGDLDVYVTRMQNAAHTPAVNLAWVNDGLGRLSRVELPSRGLGGGAEWSRRAVFGDFGGDSGLDLFLGNAWNHGADLWLRDAEGRFELAAPSQQIGRYYSWYQTPLAGDLDEDGLEDILLVDSHRPSRIYARTARGLINPSVRSSHPTLPPAESGALADIDGDGRLDIILTGRRGESARLLLNHGDWQFEDATRDAGLEGVHAAQIAPVDFDADGDLDLYVVGEGENRVLENLGTPAVTLTPEPIHAGCPPTSVEWGAGERRIVRRLSHDRTTIALPRDAAARVRLTDACGRLHERSLPPSGHVWWRYGDVDDHLSQLVQVVRVRIAWFDWRWHMPWWLGLVGLALCMTLVARRWSRTELMWARPWWLAATCMIPATASAAVEAPAGESSAWVYAGWALALVVSAALDVARTLRRRARRQQIGRYEVLGPIGEGATSTVLKGRDPETGEVVALKVLNDRYRVVPHEVERFKRSAQVVAQIRHPNVATVYEVEIGARFLDSRDDRVWLAMEFVEGASLGALREREALTVTEVTRLGALICDGVHALHEAGLIHRDIKPDNIMVTPDGQPKIIDHGLARVIGATRLTQGPAFLGTAWYMSPEQVQCQHVDERCDIWAVGVVLYELLAGRHPLLTADEFTGEGSGAESILMLINAIAQREPTPLTEGTGVSPELNDTIMRALRRDAGDRWSSAARFADALRRIIPTCLVALMCGAFGSLLGCTPTSPDGWKQPAPPPPLEASGHWLAHETSRRLARGYSAAQGPDGQWWVATGHGVRTPNRDIATPGLATGLAFVGGRLWVADGPAGLTTFEGDRPVSFPVGDVRDIVAVGQRLVVADVRGALLLVDPRDEGPEVVDQHILDGQPWDIAALGREVGVAARLGGALTATVSGDRLVVQRHAIDEDIVAVGHDGARFGWLSFNGEFYCPGGFGGWEHAVDARVTCRTRDGRSGCGLTGRGDTWWFGDVFGGLAVGRINPAGQDAAREPIDWILGGTGRAPVADFVVEGERRMVVWGDGRVESLEDEVLGSDAGPTGPTWSWIATAGNFALAARQGAESFRSPVVTGNDRPAELHRLDTGQSWALEVQAGRLESDGDAILVSTGRSVERFDVRPQRLATASVADVARAPDGRLHVVDRKSLGHCALSDGATEGCFDDPPFGCEQGPVIASSSRHTVVACHAVACVRSASGEPDWCFTTQAGVTDVGLVGDVVILALKSVGLQIVQLDNRSRGSRLVALPGHARHLDIQGRRVAVALGVAGVALLTIGEGDELVVKHGIVDTPGIALGVELEADGSLEVADDTSLLRFSPEVVSRFAGAHGQ